MTIAIRLLLIACLALTTAACKKAEEAPQETVKAPLAAPTNADDREGWNAYLIDVVQRNMEGVNNQPYVYTLPAESTPDFESAYTRQLDKARSDVARGIIAGNMLAYGGPSSGKIADMVVEAFKDIEPNTMKGVKVVFIGSAADNDRVKAAVEPAGVNYVFVESK